MSTPPKKGISVPYASQSFTGAAPHGMKDSGSFLSASGNSRPASRTASKKSSVADNGDKIPDDDDEYGGTEDDEAPESMEESKVHTDLKSKQFIRPASHKSSSVKYEDFEEAKFLKPQ